MMPLLRLAARRSRFILSIVACLLLASCGKGKLDGTYTSAAQSFTFNGGKASVSVAGHQIASDCPYTVDGKKVTIKMAGSDYLLTMNDDGSLEGVDKDKLVKK